MNWKHFCKSILAGSLLAASASFAADGDELLGQLAPEWSEMEWFHSKPLKQSELRGKVVLLRFWMTACPLCQNTSSALNEFHKKYAEKGLVVLGFYHSKPRPQPRAIAEVKDAADKLGFKFPVALDSEWKYLNKIWLTRDRSFTSASFLLDRNGKIQFVHHGGEYFDDRADPNSQAARDYRAMQRKIEELLALPAK